MKKRVFSLLFPSLAKEHNSTQNALDFHFDKGNKLVKALSDTESKLLLSQEVVDIQANEISILKGKLSDLERTFFAISTEDEIQKKHIESYKNSILKEYSNLLIAAIGKKRAKAEYGVDIKYIKD